MSAELLAVNIEALQAEDIQFRGHNLDAHTHTHIGNGIIKIKCGLFLFFNFFSKR